MRASTTISPKYFFILLCVLSGLIATYVYYHTDSAKPPEIKKEVEPQELFDLPVEVPVQVPVYVPPHTTTETLQYVYLDSDSFRGAVDVDKLISNVPDNVCKDIAKDDTSCVYTKCPCANRLPPEIQNLGLIMEDIDPEQHMNLAEDYLMMVKYIIMNSFYEGENPGVPRMTMVGGLRLDNIHRLMEDTISRNIPGDFIEAGVWKGGSCAFAAAVFKAYGQGDRKVFCSDSFKGIPEPKQDENNGRPITSQDASGHTYAELNANSKAAVEASFKKLGLQATFLEGYFKPTLNDADKGGMFNDGFMIARLDGDTYQSTWQAIEVLYPRINKGGYIIIDDYTDWQGCRDAVQDYRKKNNIVESILPVAHPSGEVRGVWWRKET